MVGEGEKSLEETLKSFNRPSSESNDLATLFPDAVEVDGDNYRIVKTIKLTEDIVLKPGNYQLSQGCEIRAKDCKLTIQPGTTFRFGDGSGIDVNGGGLYAIGTEEERIEFLPAVKGASAEIKIKNSLESKLEYCMIKGLKQKGNGPLVLINSKTYLEHCEIRDNSGVGAYIKEGLASFNQCQITGNASKYHGGGVKIDGGSASFNQCHITGNTAFEGSGVYVHDGSAEFDDCDITGNTAKSNGGGVSVYDDGSAKFDNCQITGNTAGEDGGGVSVCDNSSATLDDRCVVKGNSKPQLFAQEEDKLTYNSSIIKDGNK